MAGYGKTAGSHPLPGDDGTGMGYKKLKKSEAGDMQQRARSKAESKGEAPVPFDTDTGMRGKKSKGSM